MDWEAFARQVGQLTQDDALVRGVLTIGTATLAIVLTTWRVLRGGKQRDRVRIDAPSNVAIKVDPVDHGKQF